MESSGSKTEGNCTSNCVQCANLALYHINFSKLHGACELHSATLLETTVQCI